LSKEPVFIELTKWHVAIAHQVDKNTECWRRKCSSLWAVGFTNISRSKYILCIFTFIQNSNQNRCHTTAGIQVSQSQAANMFTCRQDRVHNQP